MSTKFLQRHTVPHCAAIWQFLKELIPCSIEAATKISSSVLLIGQLVLKLTVDPREVSDLLI